MAILEFGEKKLMILHWFICTKIKKQLNTNNVIKMKNKNVVFSIIIPENLQKIFVNNQKPE